MASASFEFTSHFGKARFSEEDNSFLEEFEDAFTNYFSNEE